MTRRLAAAAVGALMVAACSSGDDDEPSAATATTDHEETTTSMLRTERQPTVQPAALEGPITVGQISPPADPRPVDLGAIGYVEEEFFASGTATAYASDGERTTDGQWALAPASTAPFTTRLVVRRPADPNEFDGTVVVEWLNVSAVEAAPDWAYVGDVIVDDGAAWVGVSVQAFGVVGGTSLLDTGTSEQDAAGGGIRGSNPERYGSLEHPGDQYAFDIYSQIGAALRSPGEVPVLNGVSATTVVAAGESQSAGFLTTYANAIQPAADVFDGFFIHSRGAGAALLDGDPAIRGSVDGYRIRTDLDVPVLVFETETDVGPLLRFALARQPDTDRLRIWEVAGTAHADAYLVGTAEFGMCEGRINDGPQHYVAKAALDALLRWIEEGEAPPSAPPIETGGDEGTTVQRDEHGIALGGIRTPSVDVPASVLSGEAPAGGDVLCALFGSSAPFDAATLSSLYGTKDEYLRRFDAALDQAIEQGFVRAADRDQYAAEARAVTFG